jgi:hypothetical protein
MLLQICTPLSCRSLSSGAPANETEDGFVHIFKRVWILQFKNIHF